MSYLSRLTGRMPIVPPFPLAVEHAPKTDNVGFEVAEEPTGEPGVVRRSITAAVPATTEPRSMYNLREELDLAATWVGQQGSRLTGEFIRVGEEQGDVERFTVTGQGAVITVTAQLRWPDGTAVTL